MCSEPPCTLEETAWRPRPPSPLGPRAGAAAPDFTLPSTAGTDVTLSAHRGRTHVLLAFFPLAFTSTCTAENRAFNEDYDQFTRAGVTLLPISVDSVPTLKEYKAKYAMQQDLLSDFRRDVSRAYGVLLEDRFFSKRGAAMRSALLLGLALCAAACGPTAFVPPPPLPDRVYGASEVDEPAEIVLTPPLHYPEGGSDGVVLVRMVIDSAGNPEPGTMLMVQGSDSVLVVAARALVLKTLFRPARVRGRVVQVMADVPVEFSAASLPPVTLRVLGDVYTLEDLQERPHLTSGPTLNYPAALLLSRVSGRVILEAVIDTSGRVQEGTVRVVESSDGRFNQAAKAYLQAARFTPGRIAGRAVRVRLQMPVEFKLPTRD